MLKMPGTMKIKIEDDGQLAIFTNRGPIHRPCIYIMDKSCGWQWETLHRTGTGHWTFVMGRIVFTSM